MSRRGRSAFGVTRAERFGYKRPPSDCPPPPPPELPTPLPGRAVSKRQQRRWSRQPGISAVDGVHHETWADFHAATDEETD